MIWKKLKDSNADQSSIPELAKWEDILRINHLVTPSLQLAGKTFTQTVGTREVKKR